MWQGHQDTGSVTGVGLETTASTVVHAGIEVIGIEHDLVAGNPLDVGYKPNATGILLIGGVIQSLFGRVTKHQFFLFFNHALGHLIVGPVGPLSPATGRVALSEQDDVSDRLTDTAGLGPVRTLRGLLYSPQNAGWPAIRGRSKYHSERICQGMRNFPQFLRLR